MNIDKVLNNKRLIKAVLGVIGGIKKYGAASHIFRNKKSIDDTFMNVCAGLWKGPAQEFGFICRWVKKFPYFIWKFGGLLV